MSLIRVDRKGVLVDGRLVALVVCTALATALQCAFWGGFRWYFLLISLAGSALGVLPWRKSNASPTKQF